MYISKKTRVQRNLSSLAARAEGLFSLLFLIVADEQPLLPVVVLPAYIFNAPPAAVPAPAVLLPPIRCKFISCPFSLLPPRLLVSSVCLRF